MNSEQTEFLSWKIAPARLDAQQAAWFLGFETREVSILAGAGLLKPLGHPARNSQKFFATEALEHFRRDEKWLARATDAIAAYWRQRNGRRRMGDCRRERRSAVATPVAGRLVPVVPIQVAETAERR